jgi:YggT family protein
MDELHEIKDLAVDRREETLVTRQPGYVATEQVVRDVAAERRLRLYQINRVLWSLLAFMEILLAFRFFLKLIAANPDSDFAVLMYGLTGLFVAPFIGLIWTPTYGGSALELTTLFAMLVYALIFWGIEYVIRLVVDRPSATSLTIMTREQPQGSPGSIRTTHTTISNGKL